MTTYASDTFVRPNQSGFGTASDGETWTFTGHASTNSITGNEGVIKANGGNDTFAQLGTNTAGDQEVICRIAVSDNTADICAVQARFSAANGSSCYKLLYYSNAIHINKAINGANSNLANSGGFTLTNNTFYQFKLRCVGTTIEGKVWQDGTSEPGAWTLTTTDSSIASGGFAILASTNSAGGVSFDHFTATDTVVAKKVTTRFSQYATAKKAIVTRFFQYAVGTKKLASRFYQYATANKKIATRFSQYATGTKKAATRLYHYAVADKSIVTRFRQYATTSKRIASRFSQYAVAAKKIASRFYQYDTTKKLVRSRFSHIMVAQKLLHSRFSQYGIAHRIILTRFRHDGKNKLFVTRFRHYSHDNTTSIIATGRDGNVTAIGRDGNVTAKGA